MSNSVSVIIPVYNSQDTLVELTARVSLALSDKGPFEIILVNDGSKDRSEVVCREIAWRNPSVKFISFFKNFGQPSAIMAGLREASGKVCVILDDDLQNPPEEIPKLLEAINDGGYDFTFGVTPRPRQSRFRLFASWFTYKMADLMLDKPSGLYHSSFLALRGEIVKQVIHYDGPYPYLAGLIFRVTHRGTNVAVRNDPRKSGTSQYSLVKLFKLWINSFTSFSVVPLRIAALIGSLISLAGFLVLSILVVEKILYGKFLTGWVSLLGASLVFSGTQLLALGLVGEYLGRSFMLLNRSPQYSIREKLNCE